MRIDFYPFILMFPVKEQTQHHPLSIPRLPPQPFWGSLASSVVEEQRRMVLDSIEDVAKEEEPVECYAPMNEKGFSNEHEQFLAWFRALVYLTSILL